MASDTPKCSKKSIGVILEKRGKFLLIDRKKFPFYWAGVAGHIEKGESPKEAAVKEVKEEVGLNVIKLKPLIINRRFYKNPCRRGSKWHFWWVYKADYRGEIRNRREEVKRSRWFSKKELEAMIKKRKVEPVWIKIFKIAKVLR
ncbi:MAG: NUDIX hydrolase [Minisyncoccia bacterium]